MNRIVMFEKDGVVAKVDVKGEWVNGKGHPVLSIFLDKKPVKKATLVELKPFEILHRFENQVMWSVRNSGRAVQTKPVTFDNHHRPEGCKPNRDVDLFLKVMDEVASKIVYPHYNKKGSTQIEIHTA